MKTYQLKIRVPRVTTLEGFVDVEADDLQDAIAKVYAGASADALLKTAEEETLWSEMTVDPEPWSAKRK